MKAMNVVLAVAILLAIVGESQAGYNAGSMNLYEYVESQPIHSADPSGRTSLHPDWSEAMRSRFRFHPDEVREAVEAVQHSPLGTAIHITDPKKYQGNCFNEALGCDGIANLPDDWMAQDIDETYEIKLTRNVTGGTVVIGKYSCRRLIYPGDHWLGKRNSSGTYNYPCNCGEHEVIIWQLKPNLGYHAVGRYTPKETDKLWPYQSRHGSSGPYYLGITDPIEHLKNYFLGVKGQLVGITGMLAKEIERDVKANKTDRHFHKGLYCCKPL